MYVMFVNGSLRTYLHLLWHAGSLYQSGKKKLTKTPDWMISVELSEDPSRPVHHEFTVRELSTGKYKDRFY